MTLQDIKEKYNNENQFDKIRRRIKNNRELSVFYEWLAEEREKIVYYGLGDDGRLEDNPTLMNTAKNVRDCCQYWDINYYPLQGVKDLLRTNLCHNRFCDNCQNVMSIQRFRKYAPFLDALAENFYIYHIVFTQPNCKKSDLGRAIDNIFTQIKYIIRLFSGNAKIRGYDFEKYGFFGAIRALEITKNAEDGTFHPHLHTLFVLDKGLKLDENRKYINSYSFKNEHAPRSHHKGKPNRLFSDFEILLQKIWRLRLDGVRVNAKSIAELKIGYSVICDNANGNYKEVFKYATKGLFAKKKQEKRKDDEEDFDGFGIVESERERYEDFKICYDALYGRRIIQGYGKLNCFKFAETIEQDAKNDEEYWKMVAKLCEIESAERVYEFFDYICEESKRKNVTYVSRKSISEVLAKEEDENAWEL